MKYSIFPGNLKKRVSSIAPFSRISRLINLSGQTCYMLYFRIDSFQYQCVWQFGILSISFHTNFVYIYMLPSPFEWYTICCEESLKLLLLLLQLPMEDNNWWGKPAKSCCCCKSNIIKSFRSQWTFALFFFSIFWFNAFISADGEGKEIKDWGKIWYLPSRSTCVMYIGIWQNLTKKKMLVLISPRNSFLL